MKPHQFHGRFIFAGTADSLPIIEAGARLRPGDQIAVIEVDADAGALPWSLAWARCLRITIEEIEEPEAIGAEPVRCIGPWGTHSWAPTDDQRDTCLLCGVHRMREEIDG